MIPIRDENPRLRFPFSTLMLATACVLAWILLQGMGWTIQLPISLCRFGLIPADLLRTAEPGTRILLVNHPACALDGSGTWYTPVTSMFLHGGWFHLIGNLWFLWIFGDNVEDAMGSGRFLVFYLLCGLAAATAQTIMDIRSTAPMVGASGAIGGVMGAYALMYPRVRVEVMLPPFWFVTFAVPAVAMLGYWFLLQLLGGLPSLAGPMRVGGVAFWAHIGGFVAGLLLCYLFVNPEYLATQRSMQRRLRTRVRW